VPRLTYVVTHPITARLLLAGQLTFMRERGYDVLVVSSPGEDLEAVRAHEGVRVAAVPMRRDVDPSGDAVALARLVALFRREKPDIVNASTPKAGLLGMMAARAVGTPARIYLLRGMRGETARGVLRGVLGVTERIASACAHEVVCNSESLRRKFVEEGCAPTHKTRVLGAGSSNGVDTSRLRPSTREEALALRAKLGLPADAFVVGFVGRLVRDKGITDLVEAMTAVRVRFPETWLLMIGADFADDVADPELARVRDLGKVILPGRTVDAGAYYGAMDVLAFPSYREGFPNAPLEAAACGVPAVGYRATGVVDAIVDGETGTLVGLRDAGAFGVAVAHYADNQALRVEHALAARQRAVAEFSRDAVWGSWGDEYETLLARRG
jgi:glycosyltransferase involved in cell wall biosynthesis